MQNVLITGGSSGFGLAMAEVFLGRGFGVAVCGRSEQNLSAAKARCPALLALRADVTSAEDREYLIDHVYRHFGSIDYLINNAALSRAHDYTSPFTLAQDRAGEELATNLAAPIELTRLFLAQRHHQGCEEETAAIVNISTPGALFPLEANPLYAATKAGFHMFTLTLRRQLRETPVAVLEVFPPALDTNLANQLNVTGQADHGEEVIHAVAEKTVADILAGRETILPHKQSEKLYAAFAKELDENFVAMANAGVTRRPGWDQED